MEEKQRLEQFRLQAFSTPHAAIQAGSKAEPGSLLEAAPVSETQTRVVLHFDADAFCERPAVCPGHSSVEDQADLHCLQTPKWRS